MLSPDIHYATVAFESRVHALGMEIFERARAAQPRPWQQAWWQQLFISQSSHYESLKIQLFRFVDVLPVLRSDRQIAAHLSDYLNGLPDKIPGAMRALVGFHHPESLQGRAVASLTRRAARMMAEQFIAGSDAGEAIRSVEHFRRRKMAFTLDVLGEYTSSEKQAEKYEQTYLDLVESICPAARRWSTIPLIDEGRDGPMPRVNISIKLSALSAHFDAIDPERAYRSVTRRLRPILRRAREMNAFINVDMESFAYRDLTMDLFMRLLMEDEFRDMTSVGIVVQAYLRDGENDYNRLLDWVKERGRPISIRLVKGAYWDMESAAAVQNNSTPPVWLNKWESDVSFERLARRMLENHRWIRPAFASHNVRSLAVVLASAEFLGLTPADYEIQMLHGMGDPLKQAVVDLGQRLRIYTPYGELISGMGYLIRRLLENTANDSFLQQSYLVRDAGRLLRDPNVARPQSVAPRSINFRNTEEDEPMPEFRNEPITSFANAENRQRYTFALRLVRREFPFECPLVIGGKSVEAPEWIESVNPAAPFEIVGRAAKAETADADHAVAAAEKALHAWRLTPATERADILHKTADALRQRRFELAALITLEAGKPWREADADVAEAIDYLNFYAQHARLLEEKPRRRDLPGEDNYLVYEPKGVCAIISPYAFPLALLTNMTAAALAAGNTVVMKPASTTPVIAAQLANSLSHAGIPAGVVNYLPGPGSTVGRHLVNHPDVNLIAFTGSRDVGTEILRAAPEAHFTQQHLKKVIAELGGKNAIIVDDDADLDEAVGGVLVSAFGYSGQKCTSCSRAIVLSQVYDDFCSRLNDAAQSIEIGPPEKPGTVIGPLISEMHRDHVAHYIEAASQQGRIILSRDVSEFADEGYYLPPTIVADVDSRATIAQEEVFGPLLCILRARDFDHALAIANDTRYALTGGVYSRFPSHIQQAKRDFLVGNLYINRKITGSRVDVEPFGGLKMSGDGAKAGGPEYIHWFCDARTITEHTLRHGLAPAQEVQRTT